MKTFYMLYGKKACKLYDESFEKLHTTKHVKFEIVRHRKDDALEMVNKMNLWGGSRKITAPEYGMLKKILDDKKE